MQPQLVAVSAAPGHYLITEEHLLRLKDGGGCRLVCLSGQAWITAYGEAEDILLAPGQSYRLPNDALVLVGALGHCRVRVERPQNAPVWRRLALRLAGRPQGAPACR